MKEILCPYGCRVGYVEEAVMVVWGICPTCKGKFTSEGGLKVELGWNRAGVWEMKA